MNTFICLRIIILNLVNGIRKLSQRRKSQDQIVQKVKLMIYRFSLGPVMYAPGSAFGDDSWVLILFNNILLYQNCPAQSSSLLFCGKNTEMIQSKAQVNNNSLWGHGFVCRLSNSNTSQTSSTSISAAIKVRNKNNLFIILFPLDSLDGKSPARSIYS